MENTETDWDAYFENGKTSLKRRIENDLGFFEYLSCGEKRYALVCVFHICENDVNKLGGIVSSYINSHFYSDKIEDLEQIFNSDFIQQRFATTAQHYIVDINKKKVVKFLSVCM